MAENTRYPVAERFKSLQGEGVYTGTPMVFIRFVGCSVGKKICHACDTDFDRVYPELGGGMYTVSELVAWIKPHAHVCITGGEPLDRDLWPLIDGILNSSPVTQIHVETSGTTGIQNAYAYAARLNTENFWLCVSPKPGFKEEMINLADEVKVILGGLGVGPGWPTLEDAVRWGSNGRVVYLQPCNLKDTVDLVALRDAAEAVEQHPHALRLSVQLHKFLSVR